MPRAVPKAQLLILVQEELEVTLEAKETPIVRSSYPYRIVGLCWLHI